MSFKQFQYALEQCAASRGDEIDMFKHAIAQCQPLVHGTVAGHIKWCALDIWLLLVFSTPKIYGKSETSLGFWSCELACNDAYVGMIQQA